MSNLIGTSIPDAQLGIMSNDGPEYVSSTTLFKNKKTALFAVPGAFTPTCSAKHLPGFIEKRSDLITLGIDQIACISVNDVFVQKAWANHLSVGNQILMLSDGNADFVKALNLSIDSSAFGMGIRSQRFSMIIDDLIITECFLDNPGEFKLSSADHLVEHLKNIK